MIRIFPGWMSINYKLFVTMSLHLLNKWRKTVCRWAVVGALLAKIHSVESIAYLFLTNLRLIIYWVNSLGQNLPTRMFHADNFGWILFEALECVQNNCTHSSAVVAHVFWDYPVSTEWAKDISIPSVFRSIWAAALGLCCCFRPTRTKVMHKDKWLLLRPCITAFSFHWSIVSDKRGN